MLALDAVFTLRSRERSRTVRAADFFTGLFTHGPRAWRAADRRHDSAPPGAQRLRVPRRSRGVTATLRWRERRRRSPWTGAADARCARIALLSVADRPVLAAHASRVLEGERPTAEAIGEAAAAAAAHDIDPPGDIHASSAYRRHLAVGPDPARPRARLPFAWRPHEDLRLVAAAQRAGQLLAVLPAVRGQVHQAQGRARRQRAVHHDLEPHGHPPRRAAPLRDRRHDDRSRSRSSGCAARA